MLGEKQTLESCGRGHEHAEGEGISCMQGIAAGGQCLQLPVAAFEPSCAGFPPCFALL